MFVTFEGIDRSGKTTQAGLLAEALAAETISLREPGGTDTGERVRELLKDPALEVAPLAELLLFCAARAQLTAEVIRPALSEGRTVICDRFSDSSVAYQGYGRGLGADRVERLCELATEGLEPDLTVLVRVEPETAGARPVTPDRFEGEGITLQRAVAAGYEAIASRNPRRVVTVDGQGSVEEVHARVMEALASRGAVR